MGISVALLAGYCIVLTEFLQKTRYFETYKWQSCILFAGTGIVIWLASRIAYTRGLKRLRSMPPRPASTTQDDEEPARPFSGLVNLQFLGSIFMVMGGIAACLVPTRVEEPVAAREIHPPKTNAVVTAPQSAPPLVTNAPTPPKTVQFPRLKLQGIVHGTARPSALINGRAYFLDEWIGRVKVVAISRDAVTLELDGVLRELSLSKNELAD